MKPTRLKLEEVPGVQLLGMRCGRDLELLRAVLLETAGAGGVRDFARWEEAVIREHVALLVEGGYLYGKVYRGKDGGAEQVVAGGLTWAGHEMVDAIRSPGVWKTVLEKARHAGGTLAMEALLAVAKEAGKQALGLT